VRDLLFLKHGLKNNQRNPKIKLTAEPSSLPLKTINVKISGNFSLQRYAVCYLICKFTLLNPKKDKT